MGQTNKTDLIEALAVELNLSVAKTWKIVNTILESMSEALGRGESIQIRGFGTFKVKQYGSYTGRNPKTGEPQAIKPKKLPVFTVGKHLARAVDQNKTT